MKFDEEEDRKSLILALADELETIAFQKALEEVKKYEKLTGKIVDTKILRERIHAWARDYAERTVGSLDQTTAEALAQLEQAKATGELTSEEVSALLDGIFDDYRAGVVAATETTTALSKGGILAWEILGNVQQVVWQTEEDDAVDEDCEENQAASPLPIGSYFPSGHAEPPAHPNCRCELIPVYS
jgi:hypothetical protein